MLTLRPWASKLVFHLINFILRSFSVSAMIIGSSAFNNFQSVPVQNSCDKASRAIVNKRGLSTEPWWSPIFNSKFITVDAIDSNFTSGVVVHSLYKQQNPFLNANFWIAHQITNIKEKNKHMKNLEMKVKMSNNENWHLKRRINNEIDTSLETDSSTSSASEILL